MVFCAKLMLLIVLLCMHETILPLYECVIVHRNLGVDIGALRKE